MHAVEWIKIIKYFICYDIYKDKSSRWFPRSGWTCTLITMVAKFPLTRNSFHKPQHNSSIKMQLLE